MTIWPFRPTSYELEQSELRALRPAVAGGLWTTVGLALAAGVYVLQTWDRPDRDTMIVLWGIALGGAAAISLLPVDRVLDSAWREPFFLSWSGLDITLIAILAAIDGGVGSPFSLLFFLSLAFAALFYPLRLVVVVGMLNMLAFGAVAVLEGQTADPEVPFFAACLAGTALMCAWEARNHGRQRAELAQASRSDPLTGCLNRRGFEQRIALELSRAQRTQVGFSLVLLDLDDFKSVNDRSGHAAGDEVLVSAGGAIRAATRPMDAVGRLGGDEFAVLLPGVTEPELTLVKERIKDAVARYIPCSVGVAGYPEGGASADELLRRADGELYEGKDQWRATASPAAQV